MAGLGLLYLLVDYEHVNEKMLFYLSCKSINQTALIKMILFILHILIISIMMFEDSFLITLYEDLNILLFSYMIILILPGKFHEKPYKRPHIYCNFTQMIQTQFFGQIKIFHTDNIIEYK